MHILRTRVHMARVRGACAWHGARVHGAVRVRGLEGLLERLVVLAEDVDHAVGHRLLVVGAHLRHQTEVEQREPGGRCRCEAWVGGMGGMGGM